MPGRWRYIVRRLLENVVSLAIVAALIFFAFRLIPGDPVAAFVDPLADPETKRALMVRFGLDRPVWEQYALYVKNVLTGDFGISFSTKRPVFMDIGPPFTNTLMLVVPVAVISYGLGSLLGFVFGYVGGRWDLYGSAVFLVLRSTPPFWVGLLLMMFLAYHLQWLPISGMRSSWTAEGSFVETFFSWDFVRHATLPVISGAIYFTGLPLLVARGSIRQVLGEDFIDLARAKGLSETALLFRHAARCALLPVVTQTSLFLGWAMGGLVTIEQVFSWPGLGRLLVAAAASSDYPVAMAALLLLAVIIMSLNLLTDVLYASLDPRTAS
ncbi:MAG: ABC transporter permease [Gemmatimonadetes bacterium]|nr:ABC transporter permease [Gemmatimonadota bacterium]